MLAGQSDSSLCSGRRALFRDSSADSERGKGLYTDPTGDSNRCPASCFVVLMYALENGKIQTSRTLNPFPFRSNHRRTNEPPRELEENQGDVPEHETAISEKTPPPQDNITRMPTRHIST